MWRTPFAAVLVLTTIGAASSEEYNPRDIPDFWKAPLRNWPEIPIHVETIDAGEKAGSLNAMIEGFQAQGFGCSYLEAPFLYLVVNCGRRTRNGEVVYKLLLEVRGPDKMVLAAITDADGTDLQDMLLVDKMYELQGWSETEKIFD